MPVPVHKNTYDRNSAAMLRLCSLGKASQSKRRRSHQQELGRNDGQHPLSVLELLPDPGLLVLLEPIEQSPEHSVEQHTDKPVANVLQSE
jgi:hypothetical protein